jgi:hypothetical protein
MVLRSTAACGLAMILALTACATGHSAAPGVGGPAGGGSAPPASTASAAQTLPDSPAGTKSACTAASRITVQPGPMPPPLCLPVGGQLTVDTPTSPMQPWQLFTTSDRQVLDCASALGADGVATATCRALKLGTAVVSTHTAPFAGDPHGPAQLTWQVTVAVQ